MNKSQDPSISAQVQMDDTSILAMKACIAHSRSLIESARAVQESAHPNVAYHLAALALEELGRRELDCGPTCFGKTYITAEMGMETYHIPYQKAFLVLFWCIFL